MAGRPTFVLVHGAWHGAWCWGEVAARLRAGGAPVVAVDLPSVARGGDMYDDARCVRDARRRGRRRDDRRRALLRGRRRHRGGGGRTGCAAPGLSDRLHARRGRIARHHHRQRPAGLADRRPRRGHAERGRRAGGLLQHVP
ncbi:MAG: alpha/beta fold hydrolase, partial [Solirubrobacteraceae bacterium]